MNRIVKPRMSLTALGFALVTGTLVLPVGATLGLATNTPEPAKVPGGRQVTTSAGGAYPTPSRSAENSSNSRNISDESDVTVSSEFARDGEKRIHTPRRHVGMRGVRFIPYVDVSDEDIRRLADLGEGKVLPIHSLRIGSGSITDEGVRELARFANLTALDLSQCQGVSDRGLLHLNELHNLRSLRLDGPVGDEAASQLIFPKLEHLILTNTWISEIAVTKFLRRLPALRSLYIDGPQFGDNTLAAIAEMDGLETLTTTVRTTDSDDAILLGSSLKSVRLSADSKQGLARLKSLGTLRQLNLTVYPSLKDEVVDQLSQLGQLEKLYMNARGFGDQHLAALKTMTNLEELSLRGASKVSAEGISHLESELPHLEVRLRN